MGPCPTPGAKPWPSLIVDAASSSARTNSSWTESCTSTRFAQTHVCPEFRNLEAIKALTATSKSASPKTMKGALPPSSRDTRFIPSAHHSASWTPTRVDPVNDILPTCGCLHSRSPTAAAASLEQVTTEKSPGGTPACSPSSAMARAVSGVSSAGIRTAALPAARHGPTLRVIMAAGKFHGVIMAATPTGCLMVSSRLSPVGAGIVCPYARLDSSANHSKKDAAYATSPRAS
mmetsp:Transcript_4728/g.13995  ORF Transcript_4728/g.13995 Transcript_4728/m.13995 type:complete len:232 (-) Transcript_4728:466-1161(-)